MTDCRLSKSIFLLSISNSFSPQLVRRISCWSRPISSPDWRRPRPNRSRDPDLALAQAGLGYAWLLIPEYSATVDAQLSRDSSKAVIARQAVEIDPYSPLMTLNMAYILMDDGRFEEAAKFRDLTVELRPDYSDLWRNTWLIFMRAGDFSNATQALVNWAKGTGRDVDQARQLGRLLEQSQGSGEMARFPEDLMTDLTVGNENLGQVYAAGRDAESAVAFAAGLDVDVEYELQSLCPGH